MPKSLSTLPLLALAGALLLPACKTPPVPPAATGPVVVPIVGLNDFHGALYESPTRQDPSVASGGLAFLAGAVETLRAEDPDLVLLDGGDLFQGSWPVNATKGLGSVKAMNLLDLDASAVGNHEFDYGGLPGEHPKRGALEAAARHAEFDWLTANIENADGSPWRPEGFAAWTVLERKGKRIGVVGLTTTDTPQTTMIDHVDDLTFLDPVETVRALLPELEAADLDATILVAHLTGKCEPPGYMQPDLECKPAGEIGDLLTELPRGTFDVMVLGHAHTLLAQRVDDTFVLEGYARGQALNRVDLVFGDDGVDPDASKLYDPWPLTHPAVDPGCEPGEHPLDAQDVGGRSVRPSAEALALVEALEAEAGSLCTEIGCAATHLERSRSEESPLGNFVADATLAAFPEADLAIQNSGGLRADVPPGKLRREHLQAVMPFDNRLLLVELSGEKVWEMFRTGSSGGHGILQVAGATYHFDPARTGGADLDGDGEIADWETDRLCGVTVGGEPLDLEATYKVIVTDFLWSGGDHLGHAFEGGRVLAEGPLLREELWAYTEGLETCIAEAGPLVRAESPRILQAPCEAP